MATKRAEVVTVGELDEALNKAFDLARQRHGAEFHEGIMALNWEIFGRRIKTLPTNGVSRYEIAESVIEATRLKDVSPVVIGWKKWVLVGFWDPRIRDIRTGPRLL